MKHSMLLLMAVVLFTSFLSAQTPALTLNGTTNYVGNYGDILDMGLSDWSFQIWFKTTSPTAGLIGKSIYGSTAGRWGVHFAEGSPNTLRVLIQFTPAITVELNAVKQQPGNTNWNDGAWHNVSVTCVRSGMLTMYLDGVYNTSTSVAAYSAFNLNSTGHFFIGAFGDAAGTAPQAGFFLNGSLDEARVWNRALTATEVAQNYNMEIPFPQANLVGYWRMNENSGQYLYDNSGLNHTGTIYGPVSWGVGPSTLPVELSSFTAVLTTDFFVKLLWTTQSETGVSGFNVYRSSANDLSSASLVSGLIEAYNTGDQHHYEYYDTDLYEPGTYYYWLSVQDYDGSVDYHGPITVLYDNSSHQEVPEIPIEGGLSSIFPNPFNPSATIAYTLIEDAEVSFVIYNSRGQVMRRFAEGHKSAGNWRLVWDGLDSNGRACSTGVYHFRMKAGKDFYSKKAMLLK